MIAVIFPGKVIIVAGGKLSSIFMYNSATKKAGPWLTLPLDIKYIVSFSAPLAPAP
jgi:hypothetical protein